MTLLKDKVKENKALVLKEVKRDKKHLAPHAKTHPRKCVVDYHVEIMDVKPPLRQEKQETAMNDLAAQVQENPSLNFLIKPLKFLLIKNLD